MTTHAGFEHRLISGWISDYSSIPRWEPWPSITLDQQLIADLHQAMDRAQTAGYTGMILWGLLAGRSWNPYLPDTVDAERKRQVLALLDAVRQRGLKAIFGLGLYSWGFDAIIAAHPELDGGAPDKMCGSRPESWEWMQRVVNFIMDEYNPDGVSMQSSDQGRCPCDSCQEMSALEYHAGINDQVASYIRSRWPDKLIGISTWGMDLGNPAEQDHVLRMTAHVDVLNDFNNSSARAGRSNRAALVRALKCVYGTEQGFWFDPPPFWDRLKWFLPFSQRNLPYLTDLRADGGKAVERYILPLVNPGAEVGFLFDGWMMQDLGRDPQKALEEALTMVFEPRAAGALPGLVEVWRLAENGYLDNIPKPEEARAIGSSAVHYNHPRPSEALANRPEYLLRLKPEKLARYGDCLQAALNVVQQIRPDLGDTVKAVRLERCLRNALADVERVQSYRVL
jgi:hypothetical protein